VTFDLDGDSITGSGEIIGGADLGSTDRPADLIITNVKDVALKNILLRKFDTTDRDVSIMATGTVTVTGQIDTRESSAGGGAGGNVTIKAEQIAVNDILTTTARGDSTQPNGNVVLYALGSPPYDYTDSDANDYANTLDMSGLVLTDGNGTAGTGDVDAYGVRVTLGVAFTNTLESGATFTLKAGETNETYTAGDVFVNNSTMFAIPTYDVLWIDEASITPALLEIALLSGNAVITITNLSDGASNTLQRTFDLVGTPVDWSSVTSFVTAGSSASYTDTNAWTNAFYRLESQ
jgi:hypothetical protein